MNNTEEIKRDLELRNYFLAINKAVSFWCPITYVACGIILNLFTAFIYTRKRFQSSNMGILNALTAIGEACALTIGFLTYFPTSLGFDISTKSSFSCVFLKYAQRFCIKSSCWLRSFVSVDMAICICYADKFAFRRKKRNVLIIIFVILIVNGMIYFSDALYYLESSNSVVNQTIAKSVNGSIVVETIQVITIEWSCKTTMVFSYVSNMTSTLFRTFIPFTTMVTCSVMILRKLYQTRRNVKNVAKRKDEQFARTVVIINSIFLILNLPLSVSQIGQDFLIYASYATPTTVAGVRMYGAIAFMFMYLFQASQFFLNLIFNYHFRREFGKLVHIEESTVATAVSTSASNTAKSAHVTNQQRQQ